MTLAEMFQDGGWGMFPTLIFGLTLLAVSIRFAVTPETRLVPVLVALNWLTITAGTLGFVSGIIMTFRVVSGDGVSERGRIAFEGVAESLHNLAFALLFTMVAAVAAVLGASRMARTRQALKGA